MSDRELYIKVTTPWPPIEHRFGPLRLSTEPSAERPDALLCVYEPVKEMLEFAGPSVLYNCEPVTNRFMGLRDISRLHPILDALRPEQWLYHAHVDPECRVPHITHTGPITPILGGARERRAVAVVSHAGWHLYRHWPALEERNRFATHAHVDLYGRRSGWLIGRRTWGGARVLPPNYKGPLAGNWGTVEKWTAVSRYHAAVCFENTQEPYYFTEKFVDAVAAGCVPVYRAHPTVRDGVLRGAVWIDPADHGDDVNATLDAALRADRAAIAEQNAHWLRSDEVQRTSMRAVYRQVATVLQSRVGAQDR